MERLISLKYNNIEYGQRNATNILKQFLISKIHYSNWSTTCFKAFICSETLTAAIILQVAK